MLQASIAMGAGLLLFLPTFNALNQSYAEDVMPPDWMLPDEIPEDFKPPEDWMPPEDWEPPEGDYEIPEEWKEKYKDRIPPGGCPPPVARVLKEATFNETLPGGSGSSLVGGGPSDYTKSASYKVHETALAVRIYVNLTGWRGDEAEASVRGPPNATAWSDVEEGPGRRSVLSTPPSANTELEYDSYTVEGQKQVVPGDYALRVRVAAPDGGRIQSEGYVMLACGGMLAS